jgi:hypothetical protein
VNLLLQIGLCSAVMLPVTAALFLLLEKPFMYRDWPARLAAALRRGAKAGSMEKGAR